MSELPFPQYCTKSATEIAADRYERWDPTVLRQIVLHQCDALHGGYPGQPVLDYVRAWLPDIPKAEVLELGCGVGRLLAEIARQHASWTCTGLDYSTALLKRAHAAYVRGDAQRVHAARFGWGQPEAVGFRLKKIQFGLAKAEKLPQADSTVDCIVSSFLFDRLEDPLVALDEWRRALRPGGRLIVVTPLNFYRAKQWAALYPPVKLLAAIQQCGWAVLDWREGIEVFEPLDGHGNGVRWVCLGFCLVKA